MLRLRLWLAVRLASVRLFRAIPPAIEQLPFHMFDSTEDFRLPQGCQLVGIELTDDAHLLPSFRHPRMAAYILGSERMGLSDNMLELCDHVIQIPTRFSLNLAVAGALVLYDRMQSMERFAPRPLMPGGGTDTPEIRPLVILYGYGSINDMNKHPQQVQILDIFMIADRNNS